MGEVYFPFNGASTCYTYYMYILCESCQHLGNTIRENRRRLAVSQAVLAERAGVTRRFIQEVENGRSDISLQTLIRLAAALDMTLTELCRQFEQAMAAQS